MLRGTRFGRVQWSNAAVALAAAALSCVAAPNPAQRRPQEVTTLGGVPGEPPLFSIGEPCRPTGLETCFDATDDNCNGLVDEGCGLATGPLQIVAAWDEDDADVDLEVTDPDGAQAEVGQTTALGMTKDRDCPGDGDECGGQNFEVVTIAGDQLPLGRYRVTLLLDRPSRQAELVRVKVGGHIGQDSLRASAELSRQRPRIAAELLRSSVGSDTSMR